MAAAATRDPEAGCGGNARWAMSVLPKSDAHNGAAVLLVSIQTAQRTAFLGDPWD